LKKSTGPKSCVTSKFHFKTRVRVRVRQYDIDRRGRGNHLLILDNATLIEGEEGIFY
jgi:hypothetical protein